MALWKIEITQTGTINGVNIEKGMFVEMVTNSTTPPVQVSSIARSDIFYTPLGDIRTSDRRYLRQS